MDQLEWCMQTYEGLLGRNFIFTLETGEVLILSFQKKHLHHLLGLHKLSDLDFVNKKRNNVAKIYKDLLNRRIDENYLRKSVHFQDIEKRLQYFPFIQGLLNSRTMISFDSTQIVHTQLNMVKYILVQQVKDGYVHFMLGIEDNFLFPNTFLFEQSKQYITGQTILNVEEIKIQDYKITGKQA